jgi:hypothetical protein
MGRLIEEPVTTPDQRFSHDHRTVTRHPAYGQIRASRVSGRAALYGSDFTHNGYVTITVSKSEVCRDLSSDWYHGTGQLLEVSLSEAQWATFVSAMNIGDGVPCTLERIGGQSIPGIPDPVSRADQFSEEMKRTTQRSVDRLKELSKAVEGMGLPKRKTVEIAEAIAGAIQDLHSSVPFVAKRFDEHVEEGIEAAKSEIHGYMVGAMTRAGIGALAQSEPPLVLEAHQ